MNYLIVLFILTEGLMARTSGEVLSPPGQLGNLSHSDKDMYVIHATVYEVGILTNKTDNKTSNYNTTGSQESVTFYQTNGSHMDLGGIPKPLLTNVTAQSMVGVVPVGNANKSGIWSTPLGQLTSLSNTVLPMDQSEKTNNGDPKVASLDSSRFLRKLFRRHINGNTPVKVVQGTAVIPPSVGLQSLSFPPLLSLNNKLSGIPVPIPNTAVINYAKVNTLVRTP